MSKLRSRSRRGKSARGSRPRRSIREAPVDSAPVEMLFRADGGEPLATLPFYLREGPRRIADGVKFLTLAQASERFNMTEGALRDLWEATFPDHTASMGPAAGATADASDDQPGESGALAVYEAWLLRWNGLEDLIGYIVAAPLGQQRRRLAAFVFVALDEGEGRLNDAWSAAQRKAGALAGTIARRPSLIASAPGQWVDLSRDPGLPLRPLLAALRYRPAPDEADAVSGPGESLTWAALAPANPFPSAR